MDEDRVKGSAQHAKGSIKEAAGKLTWGAFSERYIAEHLSGLSEKTREQFDCVNKHIGIDIDQGYGLVCDLAGRPIHDLIVAQTNQEHGIVADRKGGARGNA